MIELSARSRETLEQINIVLHDRWFDVDDVRFDNASQSVRVSFASDEKADRRRDDGKSLVLEVRKAEELVIKDTERVGRYDFDKIALSRDGRAIRIETGIPLSLQIRVSAVDVRVFEPPGGS